MSSIEQSAPLNVEPDAKSVRSAETDKLDLKYGLKPFKHVSAPSETIEYVKLNAIDLGQYIEGSEPHAVDSRRKLAKQLDESLRTHGFFFITNHGIEPETVARLDSISQALHSIPEEDKLRYRSGGLTSDEDTNTTGAERGSGFKPRRYWGMANGARDNIEFYNYVHIVQDEALKDPNRPEVARAYINEVANYFRFVHNSVLKRITTLCDIVLELPEGSIFDRFFKVKQGDIEASGGGFGRLMMYYGQDADTNKKTENTWLRGHSDSTGFTFIASQPMISLQIRDYETETWKYVPHLPGALIVNIGDAVEFITGGYWRSTVHRVHSPPLSQEGQKRHSIIYFCKPSWQTLIDPEELGSPLLQRLDINSPSSWEKINFGQWDLEKGRLFGKSKINNRGGDAPDSVYIHGRLSERWIPALTQEQKSELPVPVKDLTL